MSDLRVETQATLLLCGRFGGRRESPLKPLESREYDRLVTWLEDRDLTVCDLLNRDVVATLHDRQEHGAPPLAASSQIPIDVDRLDLLLERGAALALAVEGWQSKGLWVLGRNDEGYPARLRGQEQAAPPLLYGAGDLSLLTKDGLALAIVGSRDVDDDALRFTAHVAQACARQGVRVVSGGARGVDTEAMLGAVSAGGQAIGVLADSLGRATRSGRYRQALMKGALVLLSPYDPGSGFSVGNAMGRNKYIYALSNAGLVISTGTGEGGTWNGAVEALHHGVPVFVRVDDGAPAGNFTLLERGAQAFPDQALIDMKSWLCQTVDARDSNGPSVVQGELW